MKTVKFRIKNYKSIVDSGDCYFADKFTILAGKNESGKTTILEALADMHEDNAITADKKPLDNPNAISTIAVSFELTGDDIKEISDAISAELKPDKKTVSFDLEKSSDTNQYTISNIDGISFGSAKTAPEIVEELQAKLEEIPVNLTAEIAAKDIDGIDTKITQWVGQNQFINTSNGWQSMSPQIKATFQEAQVLISGYKPSQTEEFIKEFVKSKLPYFIMFDSFTDVFPDSIEVTKLKDNEWAKDLEQVSSLKIDDISSANSQSQQIHQSKVNLEFEDKFKRFWTQDEIRLRINRNGTLLEFWIDENNTPYRPSQRSKGQQWYLSFYIKIIARITESKPNVILIDEPGLYLHAKAQKDILKILDEQEFKYPVVFSTHSPYLITEEKLGDVRLVEKTESKTQIIGKVWSKVSDGETLTPILTAIGLGVNDSITNLDQKNNIIAEGIEETFYLRAFQKLVKQEKPHINIISGGGTTQNMGRIGAILSGWGCHVVYVLDNDTAGQKGKKNLEKLDVLDEQVIFVSDTAGEMTVDLLSVDDFKKYIIEDSKQEVDGNSKYLESAKLDKVMVARKFFSKVNSNEVELNEESNKNIVALFGKIKFAK